MKIAILVPSWPPGAATNGIVTYAGYLIPALRRLGHEIYILTYNLTLHNPEDKDLRAIDLRRYSRKETIWHRVFSRVFPSAANFNRTSGRIVAAITELVASEKLDVLEIEETHGWSFAVSRLNLLPVVVRLHGPWFVNSIGTGDRGNAINRHREEREAQGIADAQMVTSPSANIIQLVKERYDLGLPNSVLIQNPMPAAPSGGKWNLTTCNRNTLLFVGRIDKRKGADLVIKAFVDLASRHEQLRLIMAGPDTGIIDEQGHLSSFDTFVRANVPESIRQRLVFLGPVANAEVTSLRTRCFATIVAARFEVTPYSVLEAMSLGCPLIATAVGGIPELITDHRNGLLVPSENSRTITGACEKLLSDCALAERLAHQAWQDCQNMYDPDDIAEQTIGTYKQAIAQFKSRKVCSSPRQP